MTDIINNVRTINSAVRTLMLLGLTGAVGYGGWFGYDNYVRPGFEAQQAKQDLEALQSEFAAQEAEMQEVAKLNSELTTTNERLETSMKLLKVDRRIANVTVLEKGVGEDGETYMEVRFTEVDEYGEIIGASRDFTLQGDKFYVDGWVATFDDKYVENADELRAASIFAFKSIFGDAERPKDGQRLDTQTVENGPPGIYKSAKQNAFEQKIWSDFWRVCNDTKLQEELGIRAAYGHATSIVAEEGRTYHLDIRASGSMEMKLLEDSEDQD